MADDKWIDVHERLPESADADWTRRVLAWHALNGCMVVGVHIVRENRFITHWQHTPEGPEGFREMAREASGTASSRFP